MRIGALVLGLIGAVCGFVGGGAVAIVGGAAVLNFGESGITFGSEESSVAVWRGMLAVLASIVAAGGAFMALNRPKASAAVFILTAGAGVYLITVAYAVAVVFLVSAALFAICGNKHKSFGRRTAPTGSGPQRRRPAGGGNSKAPSR